MSAAAELPGGLGVPRLGDRRTRTREGMDAILAPAGFGPVRWWSVRIDIGGPAERVWESVAGVYDLGPLPSAVVAGLRARFLDGAAALTPPGGVTPCALLINFATARRLRPAGPGAAARTA